MADDCEMLTEYHWLPGEEEDPYGACTIAGAPSTYDLGGMK